MKKYFIAIITVLLFSQSIFAQRINPFAGETAAASLEQLTAIEKIKDEIKNSISSYQKKEKFKDATGYRYAYFKGSELQVVAAFYKDTSTEKHVDWYFQNGQLIYSVQLWTDIKTKDTLDYERYYLTNERLIAWFKFDKQVDRNTVVFKKLNYRMRDYVGELKDDNKK